MCGYDNFLFRCFLFKIEIYLINIFRLHLFVKGTMYDLEEISCQDIWIPNMDWFIIIFVFMY